MKTEKTNSDYINIHINNGGIKIEIEKNEWESKVTNSSVATPVLTISADHMMCQTNQMKILITPERMKAMGKWLIKESERVKEWYKNDRENEDDFAGVWSKFTVVEHDFDSDEILVDEAKESFENWQLADKALAEFMKQTGELEHEVDDGLIYITNHENEDIEMKLTKDQLKEYVKLKANVVNAKKICDEYSKIELKNYERKNKRIR